MRIQLILIPFPYVDGIFFHLQRISIYSPHHQSIGFFPRLHHHVSAPFRFVPAYYSTWRMPPQIFLLKFWWKMFQSNLSPSIFFSFKRIINWNFSIKRSNHLPTFQWVETIVSVISKSFLPLYINVTVAIVGKSASTSSNKSRPK